MIFYWNGASGAKDLLTAHANAIQRLLTGDYQQCDLEKLQHNSEHIIYSFRLTIRDRLLFTTHKGMLHVLEYIPNHDYQKSRFLKTGVLKQYLDKLNTGLEKALFIPIDKTEKPSFVMQENATDNQGLDYYNQHFIALSTDQSDVLTKSSLPLILSGAAGSGKSYVALSMIKQQMDASSDENAKYLYITKEPTLATAMRENWEKYFLPDAPRTVIFTSYEALLQDFNPNKTIVPKETFNQWYLNLKGNKASPLPCDALYQEFRICSGFSKEEYRALGERQSSIAHTDEARDELYEAYLSYLRHLGDAQIDPDFSPWLNGMALEHAALYDFIVVDEAHGFSLLQNLMLEQLAKQHAIAYCLDPHQNLVDQHPLRTVLELKLRDKQVTSRTLNKTHRYKKQVASALDQILLNNRLILDGKVDKSEALTIRADENASGGSVYIMPPAEATQAEWLLERAKGTHLAVVTHPELIEEARDRFKTALVFTVAQIQGQEFHTIVAYKLLSDEKTKKILKKAASKLTDAETFASPNRSKDKTGHADAPWAHKIFTVCSRAVDSLVIVDAANAYWNTLNALIKTDAASSSDAGPAASSDDWDKMAEQQRARGNNEVASRIEQQFNQKAPVKAQAPAKSRKKKSPSKNPSPTEMATQNTPQFDEALGIQLIEGITKQADLAAIIELIGNPLVNLNQRHAGGYPLVLAVYQENPTYSLNITRELLKQTDRINLNQTSEAGQTALIFAVSRGHLAVVRELLLQDDLIDLNLTDNNGQTALIFAVSNNQLEIVRELIKQGRRIDLNLKDKNGEATLMLAITARHFEIAHELIQVKHADLNLTEKNGLTALMIAAANGHSEIVRALLEQGDRIDLNQANVDGNTALIIAIIVCHFEIAHELIQAKHADLNLTDKNGNTALMVAAAKGYREIVHELLKQGSRINLNLKDKNGDTALMLAVHNQYLGNVRELLEQGERVDLNLADKNGNTALMFATANGYREIVHELLKQGSRINLNLKDKNGDTALMLAVHNQYLGNVRELLEQGERVDLNLADENGNTALMFAVGNGHSEMVRELLKQGDRIDLNLANVSDNTALLLALKNDTPQRKDILTILLSDRRILKELLQRELDGPSSIIMDNLLILPMLIQNRNAFWDILKNNACDWKPSQHQAFLLKIETAKTPADKHYGISQVLFKIIPDRVVFSDAVNAKADEIKAELDEIVSEAPHASINQSVDETCYQLAPQV